MANQSGKIADLSWRGNFHGKIFVVVLGDSDLNSGPEPSLRKSKTGWCWQISMILVSIPPKFRALKTIASRVWFGFTG